jgi:nucleotide-binding universal stress UspA family protein
VIPELINAGEFDILVMGTHGHTGFKDLILNYGKQTAPHLFRY